MSTEPPEGLALRERTRRAVRAELMAVGMDLFARNGYDNTTIDEIAAAAGISRRSFFRYFTSKEDVVLGHQETLGEALLDALSARPVDEDAWTALRRAFDVVIARQDRDRATALALGTMLELNPALRGGNHARQCEWHDTLLPHIIARLEPAPSVAVAEARAEAVIAAALACLESANRAWLAADGEPALAEILDDLMRTVRVGGN